MSFPIRDCVFLVSSIRAVICFMNFALLLAITNWCALDFCSTTVLWWCDSEIVGMRLAVFASLVSRYSFGRCNYLRTCLLLSAAGRTSEHTTKR